MYIFYINILSIYIIIKNIKSEDIESDEKVKRRLNEKKRAVEKIDGMLGHVVEAVGSLGTAATTVVQQVEEGSQGERLTAGHRGQMMITCLFT